jgi:pimeloyl-ACP methyl ester carboxylesterase/DNA-binding winged helix-turn-helix (wHTH) protein
MALAPTWRSVAHKIGRTRAGEWEQGVRTSPREQGLRFGGYRFDADTGRLWSNTREIHLTPKASAVLTQLVAHAGEPVSKDDLFATVWSGTSVSDDALTSCIQELRRALDDDAKQPRFIETRHRRGYRFVARLSEAAPRGVADGANPPGRGNQDLEQEIRFCTTSDGVSIAYSAVGTGPYIVRVLGHFTHLEVEWEWPDLRRFWEHLATRHTVIRYDGRGIGLSDPYTGEFTEDARQRDLDAVLTAVGAERAVLLGISEGGWTAANYALQHPERISHVILYGAYCRGALARPGYDPEEDQALVTLVRKGWGRDTPAFRQVFTSQFFRSDADPELIAHFNELQRLSATPETAARYYESLHRRGDGRDLFRQLTIPVLIIHSREDLAVSADEGRLLASIIPGSQLVLLPSGMHYFPTDTEVVTKAARAIARFLHGSE